MVTTSQLRQGIGVDSDPWESTSDDDTPLDHAPRQLSRPARLTIASVIGLALVGLALTSVGVVMRSSGDTHTVTLDQVPAIPDVTEQVAPVQAVQRTVIVHVVGQVLRPGIVELDDGARVIDAIDAAGGVTQAADIDSLNLARIVVDGEQVYVPAVGEDVGARSLPQHATTNGPISLSRADQATLETLPGVGPSLAARIIAFRDTHGPFQSVSDVLAVSGIGPATLDRFADQVIP
jgi:competence protein ComEA